MTALPDVFLPYQQKLWSTVDRNALTVVEKSRRTGYSWALGAIAASTAAATREAGGSDVLYMGYEKDMTREFIDYVATWAKSFQVAAGEVEEFVFVDPDRPDRDIGAFRIRFASGYEVIALPSVARALRGKQGLVILDEAAFNDDLDEVLKAAMALLIWGGRVVVVSTHNGDANPFNTLVNDIRAGRQRGTVLRLTFDEAIEQGLYERICLTRGLTCLAEAKVAWIAEIYGIYRDNADEELRVIPNPATGVYLPGALLEARTDPDAVVWRWTAPKGFTLWSESTRQAEVQVLCEEQLLPILKTLNPTEPHAVGDDFARIRDLSVLWVLAIGKNMVRRTRLVVELRDVPHEQQRQIVFYVLDRLPRFRGGIFDAGGNGSYLAEVTMQRYGSSILPLQLSEPWYRDNMPPMKAGLEDATFLIPRDRDIIDDFRMLRLVRGVARVPERRRTADGENRHGDAAIAGALAYAASRADPEIYEYRGGLAALQPDKPRWHDRPDPGADDEPASRRTLLPELRGGWL